MPPAITPAASTDSTAEAPVVAPDPLASLDPADRPIAEKVRDLLAAKTDRIFSGKKERAAVEAFYQNRNLAPLWFDNGVESRAHQGGRRAPEGRRRRRPRCRRLQGPEFRQSRRRRGAGRSRTEDDPGGPHLRPPSAGRPLPVYAGGSKNIELPQTPPDAADVLTKVADASDVAGALDQFSPPQTAYQKLKAALAEMRGKSHARPPGNRRRSAAQAGQQAPVRGRPRADAARAPRGRWRTCRTSGTTPSSPRR